jgi:hypothetical protein
MKIMKRIFFLLLLLQPLAFTAQTNDPPPLPKPEGYFKINYDNDVLSATDRYYTQGIRLELSAHFLRKALLSRAMIPVNKYARNYYGMAVEHDGFTPRSIRRDSIYTGERPYASVFFIAGFLISVDKEKQQRLTSELDLGVIGPLAKGAEMQKGIHYALNNIQPLGWQYQVDNDAVLNYTVNYEKGFLLTKYFDFTGMMEARAGTLYDDISVGATIRLGWMQPYFENLGLSKYHTINRKFQCYLFIREKVKAVGYNATMQGGLFNKNSVYIIDKDDVNRVVGRADIGIVLAYKRVSVEYTKVHITPEFYNGLSHGWGHINIAFCF